MTDEEIQPVNNGDLLVAEDIYLTSGVQSHRSPRLRRTFRPRNPDQPHQPRVHRAGDHRHHRPRRGQAGPQRGPQPRNPDHRPLRRQQRDPQRGPRHPHQQQGKARPGLHLLAPVQAGPLREGRPQGPRGLQHGDRGLRGQAGLISDTNKLLPKPLSTFS